MTPSGYRRLEVNRKLKRETTQPALTIRNRVKAILRDIEIVLQLQFSLSLKHNVTRVDCRLRPHKLRIKKRLATAYVLSGSGIYVVGYQVAGTLFAVPKSDLSVTRIGEAQR
jgi:hypothetical protein